MKHVGQGALDCLQSHKARRGLALKGLETQHSSFWATLYQLVHALRQQQAVEEVLQDAKGQGWGWIRSVGQQVTREVSPERLSGRTPSNAPAAPVCRWHVPHLQPD